MDLSKNLQKFIMKIPRNGCVFICNPNNPTGVLIQKSDIVKIIDEAKQLIKNGTKEITHLGQNVNAYLYEEEEKSFRLSDLIIALEEFSELKRIKYTTSHPIDLSLIHI